MITTGEKKIKRGKKVTCHAQSRLKLERNALICEARTNRRMTPKCDNILSTGLDHAPRILRFLISLAFRLGDGTRSLEERLPSRTRAHAHLERAFSRQRRRGTSGIAFLAAAARPASTPRVMFWTDGARKGLLYIPQGR